MNMQYFSLFLLSSLGWLATSAQIRTTYYKNNGRRVLSADSADYRMELSLSDTTAGIMYNVNQYYASGKPKLTAKTSSLVPLTLQGRCVKYYPSGNVKQVANYVFGLLSDNEYNYYPNGKLYTLTEHDLERPMPNHYIEERRFLKTCNDSTGNATVTNGTGYYIGYMPDFSRVWEEGYLDNGKKAGQWKGEINNDSTKFKFIELYQDGNLKAGTSTDDKGNQYTYTERETIPVYPGGEKHFDEFMRNRIVYLSASKNQNIQGRVYISFVVEKDGRITGAKVQRAPNTEIGLEALRVVNLQPNWNPGTRFGQPARIPFTVPINFSLNQR